MNKQLKPLILICSISKDLHAKEVIKHLDSLKIDSIFLKTDRLSPSTGIHVDSSNNSTYFICKSGKTIPIENFSAIWNRKPFVPKDTHREVSVEQKNAIDFKHNEMRSLVSSMLLTAKRLNIFTLNGLGENYSSKHKIEQLHLAKNIGFNIPDTIVSSNPKRISEFLKKHKGTCIIKNMGDQPSISRNQYSDMMTKEIELDYFNKYYVNKTLDYPILIQEKIKKKYELRITIIGNKIFPCSIDSQKHQESSIDWRWIPTKLMTHKIVKLPKTIENYCFRLCKRCHLQYGAIDMAVTPDDKYIFFEINPGGQYLWIEEMTKAPLSQAMANLLSNPRKYALE